MEHLNGFRNDDKDFAQNDNNETVRSLNLIRDAVRNYFSIPWFDFQDDNLVRKFITNFDDKQVQTLYVHLIEDEQQHGDLQPKFEILPLNELKHRHRVKYEQQSTKRQQEQSILFVKFTDLNHSSSKSNYSKSSTVKIRLVTDDEAIKLLSDLLNSCTNENESIVEAYEQLERFVDRKKVLQKLLDERELFLKKLSEWSESLLEYSDKTNDSSGESSEDGDDSAGQQTKQIGYELNRLAKKIEVLKQRQQLLSNMVANIPSLFGDISDVNMYRVNLTETMQMLDSEINQLFHRWTNGVSKNIRYDLTKPCVIIDEQSNIPRITFNSQLEKFAKHSEKMGKLNFPIPDDIKQMESHVSMYINFVRDLRQIVRFYLTVAEQILLCQRPMLIDKAKAFTSLLETKKNLTWMDGNVAISAWITELKQFMDEFKSENNKLQQLHSRILETVKWMIDASLSQWEKLIDKVKLIINEVRNQTYQNTYTWRKHWDYQLYKILDYYFYQMIQVKRSNNSRSLITSHRVHTAKSKIQQSNQISMFDQEFSQWERMGQIVQNNNIELQFNPIGLVTYEPPFEELKQMLFDRFQLFVKFPSTFRAFVDWSVDAQLNPSDSITGTLVTRTLFHNIYYRNADKFSAIYHKVFDAIEELIQIRQQFSKWSAMYSLIKSIKSTSYNVEQSNQSNKFVCHTLEDYQYNLRLIKDLKTKFSNEFSMVNEIHCKHSHFVINIIPIKMFIEWLLNEAETVLLRALKDQCQKQISQNELICRQNIEQMKRKPTNINELIEFDQLSNEKLEAIHSKLAVDNVTLKEKIHFLKSWSSGPLTNTGDLVANFEQAKSILNEFENIYQNRNALLDNYRELLQSKVSVDLENTNIEIEEFLKRWMDLDDNIKQRPEVINDFQINSNQLMEKVKELSTSCEYFQMILPQSFESIRKVNNEIQEFYGKFHVLYEFEQGLAIYQEIEWIVCRNKLKKIDEYISDWIENHPTDDDYFKMYIQRWRQFLSNVEICRGDSYQQLHWNQLITNVLDIHDKNYEDLKLSDLWLKQDKLLECRAEILEINKKAFNDNQLREALNDLSQFAYNGKFTLQPYQTKDNKQIMLIKDWHQCYNQISDCFLLIQTIKYMDASEISQEYLNQYQEWETKLVKFESLVLLMNSVQRKWISMEPIYHSADSSIGGQSFFNDVTFVRFSNDFQEIMKQIKVNDGRFSHLLSANNLENRLKIIDQNFTATQKKLRAFIEESRQRFPRFYFLADEDLLLILSGKVDLNQSALVKKLFVNTIGYLIYSKSSTENNKVIEAIQSIQGEMIALNKPINTDNSHGPAQIENWLKELDGEIKSTLRNIFTKHLSRKQNIYDDIDLFVELPSQILCLFCYLDFTEKVENSIQNNTLIDLKNGYEEILSKITKSGNTFYGQVLSKQRSLNSQSTSHQDGQHGHPVDEEHLCKIKIKQVVLDLIHFITVIESLLLSDVHDKNNWCWQSQLRFYTVQQTKQQTEVQIRMGLAQFYYSFEYLGCLGDSKLVYTSLTNKCFLTLTQAMDLGLGGNPYGPAGTGKTESVKSLGQYFGRQVLVFNCDEAIDVKSMTRILVGLLKCGNWGCFDEFNRLQLDVLSVLSSQIQEIQNAIKNKNKFVNLDEYGQVAINNNAAVFITLNPAGKDYGGRNRIPDNLKSLFLPVAMTVPENKTIVRFLSLAEGFSDEATKILGEKVPCWFEFAQGSMSQQRHYDWGLRTIKACLEASGRRLNSYRELQSNNDDIVCDVEITLIIDTLRQQIKSKLVDTDAFKFDGLIDAVFGKQANKSENQDDPQIINTSPSNDNLVELIEKVLSENNLIQNEYQIEKMLQLYEQIQTRFGVVLIGSSGSGKTTIWQMLRRAMEQMSTKENNKSNLFDVVVINPKSMPRAKLFGYIDEDTREWHDGLFSAKARDITRDDKNADMHWIVFDGDIDPDWVEALNSVLDDNRVLTLPSGERIDFDLNKCRILFETTSLKNASPATISRLGVVSIDMIMINEMVQCFVAKHQLSFTAISTVQNYLNQNHQQLFLPISTARTLLEHLNYSQMNREDDSKAVERLSVVDDYETSFDLMNNLVVTKSVRRYVQILKPLVGKHICLIGPIGSGKSIIANELLFSSSDGHLLTIDCTPTSEVTSFLKILFNSTTIVHNGSNRMLRPQSGQALWLFIRHFELLTYDKWSSNSLVSLLMLILKHNGFYHPDTFEWITMDSSFQMVITCTDARLIDKRLLSSLNLIHFDEYSLEEIEQILQAKTRKINSDILDYFPGQYFDLIHKQGNPESNNLNFLKIGIDILDSLKHYEQFDEQIVDYEIYRTLMNSLFDSNEAMEELSTKYSSSEAIYYTSLNGLTKYEPLNLQQFQQQINKWIRNYCQENDIHRAEHWPLLQKNVSLIANICSFLASSTNDQQTMDENSQSNFSSIPIMMIIGSNGSGRKFLTKTIAHNFGYNKIWSPDYILNERHLNNELNSLFVVDQEASKDSNQQSMDRKLLLLIDEIHFEILPYLRDQIYSRINSFNMASSNICIRLIITTTDLKPLDHLMWLRKARLHCLMSFDKEDFQNIASGLIKSQIDPDKQPNLEQFTELFYQMFCHYKQSLQNNNKINIRAFIDFVQTFIKLYLFKLKQSNSDNERMKLGVTKLNQVSHQVRTLKDEALQQKQLLDSKRREADEAFNLIMNSMHQSEDKKVELEDVQQSIKIETDNLKERKTKIDEELSEIEPILQAAKAAIGGIRSDALSEIRSLRAPPEVIRDILEGVLRLMGVNDTSWVSMKTFLSRRGVKDEIMNFDCHKITPEIRVKVEQLLKKRSESFQTATAKRASAAAAPLAEWVKANVEYSRVLHKIEPLELELKKLESSLFKAQNRIKTLDSQLQDVDTEVDALRERMQAVTVEAAQIEINLQKSTDVLNRSESIVNNLSAEHERWTEQLNKIEQERNEMPYKCMVLAAYVTCACQEPSFSRRSDTLADCFQKFNIEPFDLSSFLDYETEEELILFGGQVSSSSNQTSQMMIPLICDPAHKALNHFTNFEITRFSAKDWLKVLELSIRFGRTLIITDFDKFDVRLVPLLQGNIHGTQDARFWTYVGEKKIDYSPKFSLYIMTDNLNNISPLTLSIIRVVNLSPNFGSISSQLLGHVINVKRPELESEKIKLDSRVRDLQKQLKGLEAELLEKLSTESGNILENVTLIEKLKFLKKSAAQVKSSLEESDRLKLDLENERTQYKELSQFAADLYFSIENLPKLCPMYYFGYGEFEQLFIAALKQKPIDQTFTEDDLCYTFYHYVSRGLFAEHRRTFRQYIKNRYPSQSSLVVTSSPTPNDEASSQTISEFFNELYQDKMIDWANRIILIITTPGSDPSTEIKNSIQKLGYDLQIISMGSDAVNQVDSIIQMSFRPEKNLKTMKNQQQKLICLNNLHLVINWLPRFTEMLNTQIEKGNRRSYPLILVSESCDQFPMALLEMCVKFTYESAPGLRSHLRRLRTQNPEKQLDITKTNSNDYIGKLRSSLEYFHVICCERRFYIPFGWTKNYEFSFNEFYFGCNIIEKILNLDQKLTKNSSKLFQYLDGLFHQVIYGGKVDFSVDELVLSLILKRCFHPTSDFLNQSREQQLKTTNDFMLLGLPLNANDFRDRSLEKRLKQNLQLLNSSSHSLPTIPTSPSSSTSDYSLENSKDDSKNKTLTLSPSGMVYFRKLWTRVLAKCKIEQIEDLREEVNNNSVMESNFLDATKLDVFLEEFLSFEFDFAKRLILQIDHEMNINPTSGHVEDCLKINKTPDTWLNVWLNGAEVAQDFLINLARIYMKLSKTLSEKEANLCFNMTHCFHPKLFLNSLKQFAAKQLSTTVDRLKIGHLWNVDGNIDKSSINIQITGISIEGAFFHDGQIRECGHDSPFTSTMTPLTITFSKIDQNNHISKPSSSYGFRQKNSIVSIPLYSCSKRQTLLEHWQMPCAPETNEKWSEMGVALILGNFN